MAAGGSRNAPTGIIMKPHKILFSFLLFSILFGTTHPALAGPTLDSVKKKGFVQCGVNKGLAGFASLTSQGQWQGIDVDICRAIAAAVFNDASKVQFTPLNAQQRFTALQSGEVDVLVRNTTATLTRDASLGINFAPTYFYDGQGFMVLKSSNIKSATELAGATVCAQSGTTTEKNMADYFRTLKISYKPLAMEDHNTLKDAFFNGRCDVFTTDKSGLAVVRSEAKNPNDYIILPETISKEPFAPAVRHGDSEWQDVVTWAVNAMIDAEELAVNSQNVDAMLTSDNPEIQRLLGVNPEAAQALKLDPKWAYTIIKTVGNYGEIFERNVGQGSVLKLDRGLNQLWSKGGILYAPPVR